jgi:hypothetical protein
MAKYWRERYGFDNGVVQFGTNFLALTAYEMIVADF